MINSTREILSIAGESPAGIANSEPTTRPAPRIQRDEVQLQRQDSGVQPLPRKPRKSTRPVENYAPITPNQVTSSFRTRQPQPVSFMRRAPLATIPEGSEWGERE